MAINSSSGTEGQGQNPPKDLFIYIFPCISMSHFFLSWNSDVPGTEQMQTCSASARWWLHVLSNHTLRWRDTWMEQWLLDLVSFTYSALLARASYECSVHVFACVTPNPNRDVHLNVPINVCNINMSLMRQEKPLGACDWNWRSIVFVYIHSCTYIYTNL